MMTLQKMVEIPADHRLFLELDIPHEIPAGAANISFVFSGFGDDAGAFMRRQRAAEDKARCLEMQMKTECIERECRKNLDTPLRRKYPTLISMIGSCKGLDTMEEYFARKQAEKEHEIRQERRYENERR